MSEYAVEKLRKKLDKCMNLHGSFIDFLSVRGKIKLNPYYDYKTLHSE